MAFITSPPLATAPDEPVAGAMVPVPRTAVAVLPIPLTYTFVTSPEVGGGAVEAVGYGTG